MTEQECIDKYLAFALDNEEVMIAAIREFHPYYADSNYSQSDYEITAQAAEAACQVIRSQITDSVKEDPVAAYKEYQADKIVGIANAVWFGMPESSSIRNHSAFPVVCELAEGY